MRRVAIPVEDAALRRCEELRCETKFDKRPNMPGQQIVIEFVDLRPVVYGLAVFGANCTQHIVEDRMESNVAKPEFVYGNSELCLTVVPNERAWVIGTN